MNINVLLLHIQKSNLDDAIKSNLSSILDKAINDADTVSRLEEKISNIDKALLTDISPGKRLIYLGAREMFKKILHGDKPKDP